MEALSRIFTWDDYQKFSDDERWEIIGGRPYNMSPGPSSRRQSVSVELVVQIHQALKGSNCRVFSAPMDVKLSEQDVIQPDLLVVCDPTQIKETHIEAPPKASHRDLVTLYPSPR